MIPQLFCKHKWQTRTKFTKTYKIFVQNIIGDGYNPTDIKRDITIEILVCEKCGKIKKLKY